MGQQQLLLVVIGVILVGLMVVVGMSIFVDHAVHTNRESLGNDLLNLAARAHEYYRKPKVISGGGYSFAGITKDAAGLARLTRNPVNDNGSYSIYSAGTSSMVEIEGVGIEIYEGAPVELRIRVFPNADSLWTVN
jgi:hypothetical protein